MYREERENIHALKHRAVIENLKHLYQAIISVERGADKIELLKVIEEMNSIIKIQEKELVSLCRSTTRLEMMLKCRKEK